MVPSGAYLLIIYTSELSWLFPTQYDIDIEIVKLFFLHSLRGYDKKEGVCRVEEK